MAAGTPTETEGARVKCPDKLSKETKFTKRAEPLDFFCMGREMKICANLCKFVQNRGSLLA
jgi:hypothetical protein